jgi:hypothetical protein
MTVPADIARNRAAPERAEPPPADIAGELTDRDIANRLAELAELLQRRPPVRDWVDAYGAGDMLSSDEAGFIAGCSADTIRRKADAAAEEGNPLGIQHASVWFLSLTRLLDWIEHGIEAGRGRRGAMQHGRHARLAAESRAKKNAALRLPPQNEPISATVAAVAAS